MGKIHLSIGEGKKKSLIAFEVDETALGDSPPQTRAYEGTKTVEMINPVDNMIVQPTTDEPSESGDTAKLDNYAGFSTKQLVQSFSDVTNDVASVVTELASSIQSHLDSADEVTMEVGLAVGAEGTLMVVKGNTKANFKVTLKWLRKD